MIYQIPQVTYVASLAPTRRVRTSMGTYSIHRLAPEYFGGYTTAEDSGVRLAKPEKALMDVLSCATAPAGSLKPITRRPGALKRFLRSRD